MDLKELRQQIAEKERCEIRQRELEEQRADAAERAEALEKALHAEQADVDRLEKHGVTSFFYQAIGKMDEKLDKERQEVYTARVEYDTVLLELCSIDDELDQVRTRLEQLKDCKAQYQTALLEKTWAVRASTHPAAQQLADSDARIVSLGSQKQEFREAISAGETALCTANEISSTLHDAENWGIWDVMSRRNLAVDVVKYSKLEQAQKQTAQLQTELRQFRTELADVEIRADLQITVDDFLKFADLFLDNPFADWSVLNHILQMQAQVKSICGQIQRVLSMLKKMASDLDTLIEEEQKQQEQLVVEAELG